MGAASRRRFPSVQRGLSRAVATPTVDTRGGTATAVVLDTVQPKPRSLARVIAGSWVMTIFLLLPQHAQASFLSPEAEDKLATYIALFVLFVVPVVLIALFWMVHILPEQIAHKRNHPQFEAIRTLCLLSLVFGGLL